MSTGIVRRSSFCMLADDFGEAEQTRFEDLPATEREQLARQLGGAVRSLRDLVDVGDVLRIGERCTRRTLL